MSTHELFFEIGTEEIPAAFLPGALETLRVRVAEFLEKNGIPSEHIQSLGTPRRLAVRAAGIPAERPSVTRLVMGPPAKAAFDAGGALTKAGLGFARAQGVEPEQLFVEQTPKGSYIAARKTEGGEQVLPMLQAFLPELVRGLPFKKSMRWADSELRFARPIHWYVALFGGEVIPFELDGIASGRTTRGLRFFGAAQREVSSADEWLAALREGSIEPDPEVRRARILEGLQAQAAAMGGQVDLDEDLLREAVYLTECPRVILGCFEASFLALPAQVPVTVMKHHQRYFPVYDGEGRLLNRFLAVINTPAPEVEKIIHGNERVLRARLSDGRFFWDEDRKSRLDAGVDKLQGIIFHARLGTSKAKVERIGALAQQVAARVLSPELGITSEQVARAALLCKADLVTRMVAEFPELQGVMGGVYARLNGEDDAVALAIEQHYLPTQAGGTLPSSPLGAVISLADKLDSVVGFTAVGLSPSAAADPFALRRQALGILNILAANGWTVKLSELIELAMTGLGTTLKRSREEVRNEVLEFLKTRLRGLLLGEGAPTDLVDAVLSAGFEQIPDVQRRLEALRELSRAGAFASLLIAFKRAANITRDQADGGEEALQGLLPVEAALKDAAQAGHQTFAAAASAGNYRTGMQALLELKGPIDAFFDSVLVMDPDPAVRARRLTLLHRVAGIFRGVADLSKISTDL